MKSLSRLFAVTLYLGLPASLLAELSLPHFFSDHMVLQREREAAIWGTAAPKSEVAVSFKGKTATATADDLSLIHI